MYDIKSMSISELSALLEDYGEPKFRAGQIFGWLQSGTRDFQNMTSLPKKMRDRLSKDHKLYQPQVLKHQVSADGTEKFLWELHDGNTIETVAMKYRHGNTVCISTQVGCRMGCAFCASTRGGLIRNLLPSEMVDQVRYTEIESGLKLSNIVMMGIGEPLDNLDNVVRFLELINHHEGMNIGMRRISLSTCGPEGGISRLAELNLQLTLSVSLHAPDDETRSRMMPINRRTGVNRLIAECRDYCLTTGRRISFEYIMADGVNDSEEQAQRLVDLLRKMGKECTSLIHVNLIPINSVDGALFEPSKEEAVKNFSKTLIKNGINATTRRRMGADIDAACGQLRRRSAERQGGYL